MKRKVQWIMAVLLLMAQGVWATAEPSQTLTEIRKMGECTVYAYMSDASNFNAVPEVATNVGQALHCALADNSVITGWQPKHRIQFFHSKTDVIVPYGNYLSFRDAHPQGEGTLFRINDTFSASDHMDAGTGFFMDMITMKNYGAYFNWICEGNTTGIKTMEDGGRKMYGTP